MLVLTRKLQEKIRIGDHITITVLRMKGKAVRIGIEAPEDVPVIRGELVFEQAAEAAASPGGDGPDESAARPSALVASAAAPADGPKNRTEAAWARDTHPHMPIGRVRNNAPQAEVHFARVPRDKAGQYLARVATGAGGPLRSMLDERSKAV